MPAPKVEELKEQAERDLLAEINRRGPVIEQALASGKNFREAFSEASKVGPVVDKFFVDVLVMAEDAQVRRNRRWLLKRLETLMLNLADVSEMVPEDKHV